MAGQESFETGVNLEISNFDRALGTVNSLKGCEMSQEDILWAVQAGDWKAVRNGHWSLESMGSFDPIHEAVLRQNSQMVQILLEKGFTVLDPRREIDSAVRNNNTYLLMTILKGLPEAGTSDQDQVWLNYALNQGHLTMLVKLLQWLPYRREQRIKSASTCPDPELARLVREWDLSLG